MTKNSRSRTALPAICQKEILDFGERIALARKRRDMTLTDMATRMMVSVKTVQRLEQGAPGISLGVLITALMCLGLEKDIQALAAMETDSIGLAHERQRLMGRQRVRKLVAPPLNDFD